MAQYIEEEIPNILDQSYLTNFESNKEKTNANSIKKERAGRRATAQETESYRGCTRGKHGPRISCHPTRAQHHTSALTPWQARPANLRFQLLLVLAAHCCRWP